MINDISNLIGDVKNDYSREITAVTVRRFMKRTIYLKVDSKQPKKYSLYCKAEHSPDFEKADMDYPFNELQRELTWTVFFNWGSLYTVVGFFQCTGDIVSEENIGDLIEFVNERLPEVYIGLKRITNHVVADMEFAKQFLANNEDLGDLIEL